MNQSEIISRARAIECQHCCYEDECDHIACDKMLDLAEEIEDRAADYAYDRDR